MLRSLLTPYRVEIHRRNILFCVTGVESEERGQKSKAKSDAKRMGQRSVLEKASAPPVRLNPGAGGLNAPIPPELFNSRVPADAPKASSRCSSCPAVATTTEEIAARRQTRRIWTA